MKKNTNEKMNRNKFEDQVRKMLQSYGLNKDQINKIIDLAYEYAGSMAPQWNPCDKKKPKTGTNVLLRFEHNMAVGFYSNEAWKVNTGDDFYTDVFESEPQPIEWRYLE